MEKRKLGTLEVSAIAFGCMGLSEFYGEPLDETISIDIIRTAIDHEITLFDTADMYGMGHNEELLGKAIKGFREKVIISTKFGIVRKKEDPSYRAFCGKPSYVKQQCESSLKRLGVDTIDLYYIHRVDPKTPIEETMGALADLIKQGKIRTIGLSEATPDLIRRAHSVHPITALETEYSLWSREPEEKIFQLCQELNIGFIAHSPIGRGFLSGKIKSIDDLLPDDFRRTVPRFQGENFAYNLKVVEAVEELARLKGCTNTQLALAWILAQPLGIVPLFGTRYKEHINENIESLKFSLTPIELKKLSEMIPLGIAKGARYPAVSKNFYEDKES